MDERSEDMAGRRAPASGTAMGCGGAAPGLMDERSEDMAGRRAPASGTAMGCGGAAPGLMDGRSEDMAGQRAPASGTAMGCQLTVLGGTVRHAIDHVEVFPAPDHVTEVRLSTDEVMSLCPVTGQPDVSSVEISYVPARWCVESKSLKLYLWSFRDRPVFAEALAAEIAGELMATAQPQRVTVRLRQHPRGGITIESMAVRSAADDA